MALQISHAAGLMWISGEDSKEKKKKDGGKSLLKVHLIHCWRPKSRNIQTYNVIVKMTWEDISHNATQRGLGGEGRSIHT